MRHHGYPLQWVHSSAGKKIELFKFYTESLQPKILIVGGMHGDEPEGVLWAETWINELNQLEDPVACWFAIRCLNPDGYEADPKCRTNSKGIDLNRNFASNDWVSQSRGPRYYPGTHPRSAPEVDALSSLIESQNFDLIIHFHSHSEACVVLTSNSPNIWAECLAKATNTPLKYDIGYSTPGSLGQWAGLELGIPVICVEELEGRIPIDVKENALNSFDKFMKTLKDRLK